jgi:hypothetical protein
MPIELDHTIVPSHHKVASAKLLAELLGVPWAETGTGPFSPVYVNDGRVNTDFGGRLVYWNEPDGHQWEMLTASYARRPAGGRLGDSGTPGG